MSFFGRRPSLRIEENLRRAAYANRAAAYANGAATKGSSVQPSAVGEVVSPGVFLGPQVVAQHFFT